MVRQESGLCNFQEVSFMEGGVIFMSVPIGWNADMTAGAHAVSLDQEAKVVLMTVEQGACSNDQGAPHQAWAAYLWTLSM